MDVSQLLAKSIPLCRDPADNTMSRSQLLHHHVEVAIQRTEGRIGRRARQRGGSIFLLLTRSFECAGPTVGFLAREVDNEGFGGRRGSVSRWRRTVRQLIFTGGIVIERSGDLLCAWRTGAIYSLSANELARFSIGITVTIGLCGFGCGGEPGFNGIAAGASLPPAVGGRSGEISVGAIY